MTDELGRKRGRAETDAALNDERTSADYGPGADLPDAREVVPDRTDEREETDQKLTDERGITDALDRMEESDAAIAKWRTAHAGDDTATKLDHKAFALPAWVNLAMIVLVVVWMAVVTSQVVVSSSRIAEINRRQIAAVQTQNDVQICHQYDILVGVKQIGRKLGLPVSDILLPDIEGLNCEGH